MRILAILALFSAAALAQTIEGIVTNAATGKGIAEVHVSILPLTDGGDRYTPTTDAQGRFVIDGPKPGRYAFFCYVPNYVSDPMFGYFRVEKDAVARVEGHLWPMPKISGRVIDDAGNPVPGATVALTPRTGMGAKTDAKGTFELPARPGSYVLSATAPPELKAPDPPPHSGSSLVWRRSFYPGVARPGDAVKIAVSLGMDVPNLELKLLAATTCAIHGVVVDSSGDPAAHAPITLRSEIRGQPEYSTESNSDGEFEFAAVVDGEWYLMAESSTKGVKEKLAQWIEFSRRDPAPMKLHLAAPFNVRVQVQLQTSDSKFDGSRRPEVYMVGLVPILDRAGSTLSMLNWTENRDSLFDLPLPAGSGYRHNEMMRRTALQQQRGTSVLAGDDGAFTFQDIYPGKYAIIAAPPSPYYLASMRVGGVDFDPPAVDLSTGPVPITLQYKADGGSVQGIVEKCSSGRVLLIPQDPHLQTPGFLRRDDCDAQGSYEFKSVRPGDYYLLAFAGDGTPMITDSMLAQAVRVSIHAGESISAGLRLSAKP